MSIRRKVMKTIRTFASSLLPILALCFLTSARAEQPEFSWLEMNCSDAGYSGRPAFKCTTYANSLKSGDVGALLALEVWSNPSIKARLDLNLWSNVRSGADKAPTDPITLKVDGQTVHQFKAAELLEHTGGDKHFSATYTFPEDAIPKLASGKELTLEFTQPSGEAVSLTFPTSPASQKNLAQLTSQTRSKYQAYYAPPKGKPAARKEGKAHVVNAEVWDMLGEAADRSPTWINNKYGTLQILEMKWVELHVALQMRISSCKQGSCKEGYTWQVRLNENAVVGNKPAAVLVFYNESHQPVFRYVEAKVYPWVPGKTFHRDTFDPILMADTKRSLDHMNVPTSFGVSDKPCCIKLNSVDFTPASQREIQNLIGEAADKERQRIAQEKEQERRRMEAEMQAKAAADRRRAEIEAENEEFDREMAARQRAAPSFAQTFANTFRNEMQAKQAQQNNQQAFLNNLAQQTHQTARVRERAADARERSAKQNSYVPPAAAKVSNPEATHSGSAAKGTYQPLSSAQAPSSTVGSRNAGDAQVSKDKVEAPVAVTRGKAMAWCMKKKNGEFWCNGPLQNGGWGTTLERALSMVDCPGGTGYTPTVGTGGRSFSCGRDLRPSEQAVPTYDPFAKYKSNFEEGPIR
ncbi:MAG TPA: hypothetical protein VIM12_14180 [Noviherbaspirillum sp.]|uniref:hypothetical protein n=1 Tax=Noviherbaspirillum sp. TaxID=1926288 RepID=UPI002F956EC4